MSDKNTRLEEIRQYLGLNKTEFAQAMGSTAHNYYHMLNPESGSNVRIEHLETLYEKTGANPLYIITGQGDKFLNTNIQEWVAGNIVPGLPVTYKPDEDMLHWMVGATIRHSQMPIIASDLGYSLCVEMCKWYMYRHPHAKQGDVDIPALSGAFLALLQTAQWLLDQALDMNQDTVVIRFAGQHYTFGRKAQSDR